jgi:protein-L-isoaspartate(D-aspartate) O-methyltransferase
MTQALALRSGARVLEIGTGSGYQAAVLAEIARDVVTMERRPALAARARRILDSLGYDNVSVLVGDGTVGHTERAPYDAIAVTAAAPKVPPSLKLQLAEGGHLVVPVGPRLNQELLLIGRQGACFTESRRELCAFVPLIGEEGWPET